MNNTIIAILYTLNALAFVIEIAVKFAVRVIALAIVLGEYTWSGAQIVYNNRREILENVNIFRNRVGSYFVYAWFFIVTVAILNRHFLLRIAAAGGQSAECPPNPHRTPISCIVFKCSGIASFENLPNRGWSYQPWQVYHQFGRVSSDAQT